MNPFVANPADAAGFRTDALREIIPAIFREQLPKLISRALKLHVASLTDIIFEDVKQALKTS